MHMGVRYPALSVRGRANSPENDSEDASEDEPSFEPWRLAMGDQVKLEETAVKLAWEWSLDDVAAGHGHQEDCLHHLPYKCWIK